MALPQAVRRTCVWLGLKEAHHAAYHQFGLRTGPSVSAKGPRQRHPPHPWPTPERQRSPGAMQPHTRQGTARDSEGDMGGGGLLSIQSPWGPFQRMWSAWGGGRAVRRASLTGPARHRRMRWGTPPQAMAQWNRRNIRRPKATMTPPSGPHQPNAPSLLQTHGVAYPPPPPSRPPCVMPYCAVHCLWFACLFCKEVSAPHPRAPYPDSCVSWLLWSVVP